MVVSTKLIFASLTNMSKTQYVGPNKILGITKEAITTPSGGEVFRVVYDNNHSELMTKRAFDLLVTEKATDLTDLRERKFRALIPQFITLMMEYDFKSMDCNPFLNRIMDSLQENFDRASNYLWTKDDKEWVPGFNFVEQRTLLECDKVLKAINEDGKSATTTKGE